MNFAVPLPGGTGGAEGGFALFYGPPFFADAALGGIPGLAYRPPTLAAPLLAFVPDSGVSIYHRWMRLYRRESGTVTVKGGFRFKRFLST